jgi:hypothetical protein
MISCLDHNLTIEKKHYQDFYNLFVSFWHLRGSFRGRLPNVESGSRGLQRGVLASAATKPRPPGVKGPADEVHI